ncbi:MAG: hypothetical protein K0R38_5940, partial [Polyangiaceae bacterium]|nr:hypothetical protein [Polyangiaceae bacterium]
LAAPDTAACGNGPACAFGFECTVVASSGCGPTPACAPGASCPDPAPCVDTQEYGCAPAPCQADADCASDMVCHAWTEDCAVTNCVCAPGEKCDCGEPTTCDPKTVSMCTPRYVLPCSAAADCGPGFTCEETESCGCSGSGGAETPPSPGSGAAPLPPGGGGAPAADAAPIPPDCSCEPSGVKQCVPQEIGCDTDAACPAGWACEEGEVDSPPPCVDGNCASRPAPLPPTKTCQPPYYGGVDRDLDDPVPPQAGGDSEGTSNEAPPNTGNPPTDEGSSGTQESSACQFGPASSSGGALSLVAVLGALFGVARRRRVK